jgi:hypothetical protein
MQYPHTVQATWSLQSTATLCTSPSQKHTAEWAATCMTGKDNIPFNNGPILNISQIIQAVMSSAAEADLGAQFINAKKPLSTCN